MTDRRPLPLDGVRVLELATVVAAPGAARYLADFGADVIKIEAPGGDSTRRMGWAKDEEADSYFWKLLARNKRCMTINLKTAQGRDDLLRLVRDADLLIENMRPGKLEALGVGPDLLQQIRPSLVVVRVSGFGQTGPYASRPGFATLADAMSGLSALLGEPDGAPLLPPVAIADEVTALVAAFSSLVALRHAERTGEGQVVDVSLLESLFQIMGPLASAYADLGYLQPRLGSGIPYSVPRGTYKCSDGVWIAISTSAETVARRVLELIGAGDDPRFATFQSRSENREALEGLMRGWVAARDSKVALAEFERVDAAAAPVMDMAAIFQDEHYAARGVLADVDGVTMQGLVARLSATPGRLDHAGPPLNNHERLGWLASNHD
jgi:crotonobetainyl-CoA:carnitine CoA-transferase CaiB-like acyl-CoA transferase